MSYMEGVMRELSKPLKIEDVQFRVQSINGGGYGTILAYKDSRVDMRRLDQATNGMWKREHEVVNNNLFCTVSIYDIDTKQWVSKQDVGTQSMAEKQKGEASDSFKRACFNWGIGRNLYDFPLIQIKLNQGTEIIKDGNRFKQAFGLKLGDWNWTAKYDESGNINMLAVRDVNGTARFYWTLEDGVKKV